MSLRSMYDAAFPVPSFDRPFNVAAGYIGGDTLHVWSDTEWSSQMQLSGARYKLPIFTRSNPESHDPLVDSQAAINWLTMHNVPKGTTLALDYETAVNAQYLQAFDRAIFGAGWLVMVYGSQSFVIQNPKPSGGYWMAEWSTPFQPHLIPGSAATQYASDTQINRPWDESLVADATPLWDMQGGTTLPVLDSTDLAAIEKAAEQALHNVLHLSIALSVPNGQVNNDSLGAILVGAAQNAHNDLASLKTGVTNTNSFLTNEQRSFNASLAAALANLPTAVVSALPSGAGTPITVTDVETACSKALDDFIKLLAAAVP